MDVANKATVPHPIVIRTPPIIMQGLKPNLVHRLTLKGAATKHMILLRRHGLNGFYMDSWQEDI